MAKKIILAYSLLFVLLPVFLLIASHSALAAEITCTGSDGKIVTGEGCNIKDDSVKLVNPIGGSENNPKGSVQNVPQLIGKIINALLGIVGSLALIMFIYGGFTWMLAAGNETQVEKGRNILVWATIGLVVIFASYSLTSFIIKSIAQ
jgi:hypothetical protein